MSSAETNTTFSGILRGFEVYSVQDGIPEVPVICPTRCPKPSSSTKPVCAHHQPPRPVPGHKVTPPLDTLASLEARRLRAPSLGTSRSPSPRARRKSKSPAPTARDYNIRFRKFLLFCIAVELEVEAYLEKDEFLTSQEFIDFVQLAQFHCERARDATIQDKAQELAIEESILDPALDLDIDSSFALSMLPTFVGLMRPSTEKSTCGPRQADAAFWKSTLKQRKSCYGTEAAIARLNKYAAILPSMGRPRVAPVPLPPGRPQPLDAQTRHQILQGEMLPDRSRDLEVQILRSIARLRDQIDVERHDSVHDDRQYLQREAESMLGSQTLPGLSFELALGLADRLRHTIKIEGVDESNRQARCERVCSHGTMRAVWVKVFHNGPLDRFRRGASACKRRIRAHCERVAQRFGPPSPRYRKSPSEWDETRSKTHGD